MASSLTDKLKWLSSILLPSFILNPALSEEYSTYHQLSQNRTESENYEIHKVLGKNLINATGFIEEVYFSPQNNEIIVKTEVFESGKKDYWKMSISGEVIDTFTTSLPLYPSGYFFNSDYYIEWTFNGNKSKQAYAKIMDADELSDKEFDQLISQSTSQDFEQERYEPIIHCFLKIDNELVLAITKRHYEKFSYQWVEGLNPMENTITYNGAKPKLTSTLYQLRTSSSKIYSSNIASSPLTIKYFEKQGHVKKQYFIPNGQSWHGDYGMGYYQLQHQNETFKFKSFSYKSNGRFSSDFSFYEFPKEYANDSMPIFFQRTVRSYNLVDSKEIGLFIVRKKSENDEQEKPFSKNNLQQTFDWKATFIDFPFEQSELKQIRYFNGNDEYLKTSLDKTSPSASRFIPKNIVFSRDLSIENSERYRFIFDDKTLSWDTPQHIYFMLAFEQEEMLNAFEQFSDSEHSLDLQLRVKTIGYINWLTIVLSDGKKEVSINKATLRSIGQSYRTSHSDEEFLIQQEILTAKFDAAIKENSNIDDFLKYSSELVANTDSAKRHSEQLHQHIVTLLIHWITNSEFEPAKIILSHYVNAVMQQTGKTEKTFDIASNGLVLGILSKDKTASELIFQKLLGKHFDIEKINNNLLLFNLASYYSLEKQKGRMLQAIKLAIAKGKTPDEFKKDGDFEKYWDDKEFLRAIE